MKKLAYLILLVLILASCAKKDDIIIDSPKAGDNLKSLTMDMGCSEPVEFALVAGQYMDVGTVTITNDEENLYVNYQVEGEWLLSVFCC